MQTHLLVVDDDERIRLLLQKYLIRNDFLVSIARDAAHARRLLIGLEFDMIILDVMMPGEDGVSLTQDLRRTAKIPILLLTAKNEIDDRIAGLEAGADDYLAKPFEPKELILRIKNILNKTKRNDEKRIITFDNIKIDLNKLLIIKNDTEYKINSTEKIILEKMINNPGKTFSREDIGKLTDLDKERSIDVIITRLRKKIEIDPKNPKYLQTLRGAGYVLWIE